MIPDETLIRTIHDSLNRADVMLAQLEERAKTQLYVNTTYQARMNVLKAMTQLQIVKELLKAIESEVA